MISSLLRKLEQGDLRTTGKAEEVVEEVLAKPELFDQLFQGLFHSNAGVRMRSADALEKISAKRPDLIQPYKIQLINQVSKINQQEVQWHLAQMYSYLTLTREDQEQVATILISFVKTTKSNIVKVFSLQTLSDLAMENTKLKLEVIALIKSEMKKGAPSIVSRGKKLLKKWDVVELPK